MIQVTATMRILVAIEPVDLRKYAPSMIMRSCAVETHKTGLLRGFGRRITGTIVEVGAWRGAYPAVGSDRGPRSAETGTT
jgi:hypothetical protein